MENELLLAPGCKAQILNDVIMDLNFIVIDNFLEKPDNVRQAGLAADYPITGNFPGRRSYQCDQEYNNIVKEKIETIINKKITEWTNHTNQDLNEIESIDTSSFQLCLEDDKTWIHRDINEYTAILYLTPNAPTLSGTGIYKHIKTNVYQNFGETNEIDKDTDENSWELINFVGNIFNRLVIFKGCLYHRSVLPGFGHDKYTGRLTQTFFFNTQDHLDRKKNGNY